VNALRVNVTETLNPKSNRLDALIAKHTAEMIRTEALRFLPNGNFSASYGWKDRFKKRKRLTVRRITTSGRESPRDAPTKSISF
jgi:hypothetical protein